MDLNKMYRLVAQLHWMFAIVLHFVGEDESSQIFVLMGILLAILSISSGLSSDKKEVT